MAATPESREEAMRFGRYLLGQTPSERAVELYRDGVAVLPPLAEADARLLAYLGRNPWAVGPVDAALAVLRPSSGVRQRILLMLCVLECLPEYAPSFLPATGSRFNHVRFVMHGTRAVFRALGGLFLLGVIRGHRT